jgi:mono-ADP-ribosyltransferase sirtuin 6
MNVIDDPHHSNCCDPEEDYNRGSRTQSGFTPTDRPTHSPNENNCVPVLLTSSVRDDYAANHKPCSADWNVASTIVSNSTTHRNSSLNTKLWSNKALDLDASSKSASPSFASAIPTYTHRALTHLILQPPPLKQDESDDSGCAAPAQKSKQRTYLHHIVTQNVDGLHRKSRLPRKHHSILHGDIFTEVCDTCHTEHVRPFEISSIGLAYTGRKCTLGGDPPGSCGGRLKDTLLDWENDLPEEDWKRAQEECMEAELIICMGTSLNIEPAASLCTFAQEDAMAAATTKKKKLGYVIINLQKTPYDDEAALVIRGKVDDVMEGLMWRLGYSRDWDDLYDYGKKN